MKPAGHSGIRNDRVVILARGLGTRMGAPKGLLKLSASGGEFVRIIAALYLGRNMPVDVVVNAAHCGEYRAVLPDRRDCRLLPAEPGGDTALSLLVAWRACRSQDRGSHFWAHPVDLPLVAEDTITELMECSRRHPGRIIRPVRDGIPGHPVILPYDVLAALEGRPEFHQGPLREFLAAGIAENRFLPPVEVSVRDPGIDRDFDSPGDFDGMPFPPTKEAADE